MKLNPDCVRDVLLCVENTVISTNIIAVYPEDFAEQLNIYSDEELLYHVRQCSASGFFLSCKADITGNIEINDLSPKGHEFLANIRKDTIWNGVKSIAGKVGTVSLGALSQIATNVISELIKSQFGINHGTSAL